jgi:hypothetical protein
MPALNPARNDTFADRLDAQPETFADRLADLHYEP